MTHTTTRNDANEAIGQLCFADPAGDYELTIWIQFAFDNYTKDASGHWSPVQAGDFVIAAGRLDGAWRFALMPRVTGADTGDHDVEEPILILRDQRGGAEPLALLRALLTGGTFHQDDAAESAA
jgi:hypothetical protein